LQAERCRACKRFTAPQSTTAMKLYVKYMVSRRCKMMVREELRKLGVCCVDVDLGVVEVLDGITDDQRAQLNINLKKSGLELLDDKRSILVERIKTLIIEMIQHPDHVPLTNYSNFISDELGYDYTYLSNVFSEVKGIPIQQYIILNKIEKVKELLLYDELTLTEISYMLHYSSVAHLSNQFKKMTGHTPSYYKHLAKKRRMNLEDV
jgi:AraC-like DNA-binding protein